MECHFKRHHSNKLGNFYKHIFLFLSLLLICCHPLLFMFLSFSLLEVAIKICCWKKNRRRNDSFLREFKEKNVEREIEREIVPILGWHWFKITNKRLNDFLNEAKHDATDEMLNDRTTSSKTWIFSFNVFSISIV